MEKGEETNEGGGREREKTADQEGPVSAAPFAAIVTQPGENLGRAPSRNRARGRELGERWSEGSESGVGREREREEEEEGEEDGEAEISSLDISGSMAASLPLSLSLPEELLFPPIITGKLSVRGCDRRRRGERGREREGGRSGREERANFPKKLMRV